MKKSVFLAGLGLLAGVPAYAFPPAGVPQTSPLNLTGNGQPASAVFVFSDAGDSSNLNLVIPSFGLVFNNKTATVGEVRDVGSPSGTIRFELADLTTGETYRNGTADTDGFYHFYATNNYSAFGVGALPTPIADYIAALTPGTQYIFVGAEDRSRARGSDFDYNDIIYLFTQFQQVPSPATLGLFGLGVLALGAVRRRG